MWYRRPKHLKHRSLAARLLRLARREARSHVTMLRGREYRALICAVDPFTGGTTTCAVIFQSEA